MQIKLTQSIAGPELSGNAGEEVEVADATGQRLIKKGLAVPVRSAKVETTTKKAKKKETATK